MRYKYLDLLTAFFVTIFLVSNIASSAKIIDWGISVDNFRLVFDAGTMLFPLSYIFGDVVTEVYGYRVGRRVIWIGFISAALMCLTIWLVGLMPAETNWSQNVGQDNYYSILGGLSSGALVIASLVAYWAGEFSNSFVLAKLKIRTAGRWLWIRTIGSTLIGEGIDLFVFITIATLLGVPGFLPQIWFILIVSNYLFKCTVEILMTPVTYFIVNRLKKAEQQDYFDVETNFNPFLISDSL